MKIYKFRKCKPDEVFLRIFNDFNLFLSETYRLHKKVGEYEKDGYKVKEILKITLKSKSNMSYIST